MQNLTTEGQRLVEEIGRRHGFGADAVLAALMAVAAGGGRQAQFSHPELGGMGQWSQGGMTMIGDMFNNHLKARVDGLLSDLANALGGTNIFQPAPDVGQGQSPGSGNVSLFVQGSQGGGSQWPEELGHPSSTGSQNNLRYAFFPGTQRLAIDDGGRMTVYDTGDHMISGFSQQQGGDQSLTFTSQRGLVRVADLPVVQDGRDSPRQADTAPAPKEAASQARSDAPADEPRHRPPASEDDIFAKLERLADLHRKGIVTTQEFEAKKAELLSRL